MNPKQKIRQDLERMAAGETHPQLSEAARQRIREALERAKARDAIAVREWRERVGLAG